MTDEFVFGGDATDIPPGTYPAKLADLGIKTSDAFGDFRTWDFTLDSGSVVGGASSMNTGPKSKGGRWAAALNGGTQYKGSSTALIGRPCLVVVGLDKNDWPVVTDVLPPLAQAKKVEEPLSQVENGAEAGSRATSRSDLFTEEDRRFIVAFREMERWRASQPPGGCTKPSSEIGSQRITRMTQMPRTLHRERIYADMADKMERDPIYDPDTANRASVPMGRGFALWQRMNAGAQLVWVDDAEGHPRALTPKQAQVLAMALEMAAGAKGLSMRDIAQALGVAPSTVSRALTKFAAWGLVAYFVGRGRFGGLVIFRRAKDDGFDRVRKAAKARVQRWSEAARRRISRLEFNVASYILEGGRGYDTLTSYALSTNTYKDATLTAQPFTAADVEHIR